jgi:Na+/melibiose symporter-like transporter
MLRRIWTFFMALTPVKRALVAVYLVAGVVGGALVTIALEGPQHRSWIFLALGGVWVALSIVLRVLTFASLARRRHARREAAKRSSRRQHTPSGPDA